MYVQKALSRIECVYISRVGLSLSSVFIHTRVCFARVKRTNGIVFAAQCIVLRQ